MGRPIPRSVCPEELEREIRDNPFLAFFEYRVFSVRNRVLDVLQRQIAGKVTAHQVDLHRAKHIVEDLLPLTEDKEENKHWRGVVDWLLRSQKDAQQDVWVLGDLLLIYMNSNNMMQEFLAESILDKVIDFPNLVQRIEKELQAFLLRVLEKALHDPVAHQHVVRKVCKCAWQQQNRAVLPLLRQVHIALYNSSTFKCPPADRGREYYTANISIRGLQETIRRLENMQ